MLVILGGSCWVADGLIFFVVVQSVEIAPCFSESWTNVVNVGVSLFASVLRNLVGMWSDPVAICSLSVVHSSL